MQMNEADRIPVEELTEHPLIAEDLASNKLAPLNTVAFNQEMT